MQNPISTNSQDIFLKKILDKVEDRGLGCNRFRRSYIERRLATRLRATGCQDYLDYYRYLDRHANEYPLLINALTINVTQFFRDEGVYRELEANIFPAVIADTLKQGRSLIRIWSAGCSTGEEVFSVAMIMARCLEQAGVTLHCSIHGTDTDEHCVGKGRQGVYPIAGLETIPYHYRKYIVKKDSSAFTFTPQILQMSKFKKLDLFADRPINQAGVVLCRNVMIYFDHEQQQQLIDRFYNSITHGGYLCLGKSEKLQHPRGGFVATNVSCRIYRKVDL